MCKQHEWGDDLIRAAAKPSRPDRPYFIRSCQSTLTVQWCVPEKTSEDTNINFSGFKANSAHIDRYDVARRELPSGEWVTVEEHFMETPAKPGLPVQYKIKDNLPGTEYEVRVRAHSSLGYSPWSYPSDSMRTKTAVPSVPCMLEFVSSDHDTVTMEWFAPRANGSDIDLYEIARKDATEWGHWDKSVTVTPDKCHAVDCEIFTYDNLTNCSPFRFRIRAHNEAGWSDWSIASEVMATTGLMQLWYKAQEDINKIITLGHERMARDSFNQWIIEQHSRGWLMDVDVVNGLPCMPQLYHHMAMVTQRVEGRGRKQINSDYAKSLVRNRERGGSLLVQREEKIDHETFKYNSPGDDEGSATLIPLVYRATPQPKKAAAPLSKKTSSPSMRSLHHSRTSSGNVTGKVLPQLLTI